MFAEEGGQLLLVGGNALVVSTAFDLGETSGFYSFTEVDAFTGDELDYQQIGIPYLYAFKRESVIQVNENLFVWSGIDESGAAMYAWDSEFNVLWSVTDENGEFSPPTLLDSEKLLTVYRSEERDEMSFWTISLSGQIESTMQLVGHENTGITVWQVDELSSGNVVVNGVVTNFSMDIGDFESDNVTLVVDSNYELLWEDRWGGDWDDGIPFSIEGQTEELIVSSEEMLLSEEWQVGVYSQFQIESKNQDTGEITFCEHFGPQTQSQMV
ncbi:MAG: hypothetical protein MK081_05820 [Flavobacteriales bacterium]|nr:hypothetical protein [Flavobacteriales bacterium]